MSIPILILFSDGGCASGREKTGVRLSAALPRPGNSGKEAPVLPVLDLVFGELWVLLELESPEFDRSLLRFVSVGIASGGCAPNVGRDGIVVDETDDCEIVGN